MPRKGQSNDRSEQEKRVDQDDVERIADPTAEAVLNIVTEAVSALRAIAAGADGDAQLEKVRSSLSRAGPDPKGEGRRTPDPIPPFATTFREVIGDHLRELRKEAGWTQRQVSDAMTQAGFEWNRTTCAEVERGVRRATIEELLGLAALFRTPAVALLIPSQPLGLQMPRDVLTVEDVAELFVGPGGTICEGPTQWTVADKALGASEEEISRPEAPLWWYREYGLSS